MSSQPSHSLETAVQFGLPAFSYSTLASFCRLYQRSAYGIKILHNSFQGTLQLSLETTDVDLPFDQQNIYVVFLARDFFI